VILSDISKWFAKEELYDKVADYYAHKIDRVIGI
jgi:hypothetical protein